MNQVKAGVVLNYLIIGLNTLVGLLYTPYMLRCLGQNEYGLYSLVASVIAYLTILDFGFGNAIIRYTSKLRAERRTTEQWELFGTFIILYTIVGIVALGLGCLIYFNVDYMFDHTMTANELAQARIMMLFLIINLAVTFPFSIFTSIITAYEDFVFQKVLQIIRILLCTVVLVVLLYWGYKAVAMVIVHTFFNIATLLINFFYCKYRLHIKILFKQFDWKLLKEIGTYSFWIFLNSIMDRIYWGTGQFVLGAISGTVAVAVFSVAITLQQMYMQFSNSIAGVLLPRITRMVTLKVSYEEISEIFLSTGRIQAFMMMLILGGFIVFGASFIQLWAGSDYEESYIITLILMVAMFVPLIQNVGISILQARNQLKFRSIIYFFISILSLGLQIWLAHPLGALGCSIAIASALVLGQGLIMNLYYAKVQKINIKKFWIQILYMSKVPFLLTFIGCFIWYQIAVAHWMILFVGVITYSSIYIGLMYLFGLNQKEKNLINKSVSFIEQFKFRS